MDGIRDRAETAVEALTVRKAFVITSIFGGAAFAFHYIPQLPALGSDPKPLGLPAIGWAVIVALVMTIYFLFEYAHRKRMETVPSIIATFDPDLGVVETPTLIVSMIDGKPQEQRPSHGTYVRLKIETKSKRTIEGCAVFLTLLEKKNVHTGLFEPIQLPNPIPVIGEPVSIFPRIPRFVDFFQVGEENIPRVPGAWPLKLADVFSDRTVYRFTLDVTASHVTSSRRIEVKWSGVWQGVSAISGDTT